jgi:succinate dehydrogenase / fumarate reductase membrane anchor subunit
MLIEDYMHGLAREITIILLTCLSYGAAATGVFAIAKIAL